MRRLSLRVVVRRVAILACVFAVLAPARSNASVSFTNPTLIPTANDVLVLAAADVNKDGKLDLVYIDGNLFDSSRVVHVLLGNGDGTFRHIQDVNLSTGGCCALAIADVTNDGIPDLIVAGGNALTAVVSVMVGNGDGTFRAPIVTQFQPPNSTGDPGFNSPVDVGDINGDGKMDLVLTDRQNGAIFTLLGDNSGNFTYSGSIQTYTRGPTYLVDLNGDRKLDLVATDPIGADFLVFLGKGDGTFPSFTRYTVSTPAGPFLLLDVNRDGHPDIFFSYYPNQLGFFPGNADGTFGAIVPLGNAPSTNELVAATDLTGDGIADLTFITPSGIAVSPGQAGPVFGSTLTTITGGSTSPYSLLPIIPTFGDFNGDGHIDMALAAEGGIAIYLGKGDGTFASVEFYEMGQEVGSAAIGRFSGSAFQDIAVSLPATFPRLLLGNGTGKFTLGPDPNTSYSSGGAALTVLPADFNGDGKPDLNVGTAPPNESFSGTDSVAINAGNGTFESPVSVPNSSAIMADFNADGRTDLINLSGDQIIVSLGQTDGSFIVKTTTLRLGFDSGHFNVGDVNGDGKPDLILNYLDHLEVWFGNGDGTFIYSGSVPLTNIVSDFVAAIADLDGDGNEDIIMTPDANVAASLGPMAILYGKGDGTFQPPVFVPLSHRYSWVTVADLNADGKPDLILTDGAAIAVMLNLGGRTFDAEADFIAGRSVSIPVSVADVNGDGLPDIVVGNSQGTTVAILLNQGNVSSPDGAEAFANFVVNPEPSNFLNPFAVTIALTGGSSGAPVPTGNVSFSVDNVFVTTNPVTNGSATWTEPAQVLVAGQHTISAAYNGDGKYAPRIFSVIHTVTPPVYTTQTTLTCAPQTLLTGETVRLKATVSGPPVPTGGNITFYDGTNSIGASLIDAQGNAYRDTSLLSSGVHSITATYQGYTQIGFTQFDTTYVAAIYSPSTSGPVVVTVNTEVTTTALSPSSTSPTAGTVVTLTATVSSPEGPPFGGATFYDGASILGTMGLSATGTAAFSTASLSSGTHTITASFNANGPFGGSTSPPVTLNVAPAPADRLGSMISLSRQVDPGAGVSTLMAAVSGETEARSGTVTFIDNGTILGTAEIAGGGTASRNVGVLASGIHSLTASFAGNTIFGPSVSPELYLQWPQPGPGFSLSLSSRTRRVTPPDPVEVTIEGTASFKQSVQLSCAGGLPAGYVCNFSPAAVTGSGASTLTIRPQSEVAWLPVGGMLFFACVIGIYIVGGQDRESRLALLLLAFCALGVASACSTAPDQTDRAFVLTVRATSGTGASTIIQSAQIQVVPHSR
jgi:hypothetical protein